MGDGEVSAPDGVEVVLYRAGEGDERLGQEFFDAGMLWAANRELHPFGWALTVAVDADGEGMLGLGLMRTRDPEGFVLTSEQEIEARRKFLAAVWGKPLGEGPLDRAAPQLPTVETCECDAPLWHRDGRSGCPNPRCSEYVPFPRSA